ISVHEAQGEVLAAAAKLSALAVELIPIERSLGRVLAADLTATLSVPRFTNSAMDGYALHARSTKDGAVDLHVIGESAAGDVGDLVVTRQECARIFTGAPIPKGCDAVVMQENVTRTGDHVHVPATITPCLNIRSVGEDVAVGALLIPAGTRICAGEIALAATQGRAFLSVRRRPVVAIIATGDELVEIDTLVTSPESKIGNGNALMLAAQVVNAGAEPVRLPIVRDTPEAVSAALLRASSIADVVITTGGVSVGDRDYVGSEAAQLGTMVFHKVRMRPGKPVAFGIIREKAFFGLPGNPVSSYVAFELFVWPLLRTMLGAPDALRASVPVKLDVAVERDTDRPSYLRAKLRWDGATLAAAPRTRQGSGDLTGLRDIDGLVTVDAGNQPAAPGEIVPCLLLRTP
ncbi:MAG: molybdopterin molybdotransferase MoeA, partial [Clostridia bacterium]|nr:molybdopterin molybdotransferase MoeA [Deltaproteobacteria bacterium]